jgi:hypothetical protein
MAVKKAKTYPGVNAMQTESKQKHAIKPIVNVNGSNSFSSYHMIDAVQGAMEKAGESQKKIFEMRRRALASRCSQKLASICQEYVDFNFDF